MAITAVQDVTYEPWGGYEDPRLPTRVWKGRIQVTGDASGGDISAFLRFNLAGVERLDSFYSLEELWMSLTETTAVVVRFQTRNFGSIQTGIRPISTGINNAVTQGPGVGMSTNGNLFLPAFLGQQVTKSTLLEMVFDYNNVLNDVGVFWAGGYTWGPRSASAPNGGIVRPNPGLFPV